MIVPLFFFFLISLFKKKKFLSPPSFPSHLLSAVQTHRNKYCAKPQRPTFPRSVFSKPPVSGFVPFAASILRKVPFFLSYFPSQAFSAILILKSLYIIFITATSFFFFLAILRLESLSLIQISIFLLFA